MYYHSITLRLWKDKIKRLIMISFSVWSFNAIIANFAEGFKIKALYFFWDNYFFTGLFYIVFSYAFTMKFNEEFFELEDTSKKLNDLNENLEKKVDDRTQQLKEVNERQVTFFTNFVHETKTPLTLIANYLKKYIAEKGHAELS